MTNDVVVLQDDDEEDLLKEVLSQTPGGRPGIARRLRHAVLGCEWTPHLAISGGRIIDIGWVCPVCWDERP